MVPNKSIAERGFITTIKGISGNSTGCSTNGRS